MMQIRKVGFRGRSRNLREKGEEIGEGLKQSYVVRVGMITENAVLDGGEVRTHEKYLQLPKSEATCISIL